MRVAIDQDVFAQSALWLDDDGGFHEIDPLTGSPADEVVARVDIADGYAVFYPPRSASQRAILERLGNT